MNNISGKKGGNSLSSVQPSPIISKVEGNFMKTTIIDQVETASESKFQNQKKCVFEKYRLKKSLSKVEIPNSKVVQKPDDLSNDVSFSLSSEIALYIRWIDCYQSEQMVFVNKVFRVIKLKILKHFLYDPEVW